MYDHGDLLLKEFLSDDDGFAWSKKTPHAAGEAEKTEKTESTAASVTALTEAAASVRANEFSPAIQDLKQRYDKAVKDLRSACA